MDKAKIKELVCRYSRGNTNLKVGRFVTAEEKEERKRKILEYKFAQ